MRYLTVYRRLESTTPLVATDKFLLYLNLSNTCRIYYDIIPYADGSPIFSTVPPLIFHFRILNRAVSRSIFLCLHSCVLSSTFLDDHTHRKIVPFFVFFISRFFSNDVRKRIASIDFITIP